MALPSFLLFPILQQCNDFLGGKDVKSTRRNGNEDKMGDVSLGSSLSLLPSALSRIKFGLYLQCRNSPILQHLSSRLMANSGLHKELLCLVNVM